MVASLLPRFLTCASLFLLLGSAVATDVLGALVARDGGAVCSTYTVAGGDTCTKIAQAHGITVKNIEDYNARNWGWHGCAQIQQGEFICVVSGEPPMPVALPHATCGPQVPGTCSNNGQCGTTSAFCSSAQGCISHCKENAKTKSASEPTTTKSAKTTKFTTSTKSTTTSSKTSKTTTTAASASPDSHWQLTMYSKKNCEGDYYLLQGYNTGFNQCLRLQNALSTDVSGTGVSCRWWSDGGFGGWTSCDKSDLKKPVSWFMDNGSCWVYPDNKCDEYSGVINEGINSGCQSDNTMATEPDTTFGSLKCAQIPRIV